MSRRVPAGISLEYFALPSRELARVATYLGRLAWMDRFPERGAPAIDRVFDIDATRAVYDRMAARSARAGRFVGIVAQVADGPSKQPVGVAWGGNDRTGSVLVQGVKRALELPPYAALDEINVDPKYQRLGIGTAMLDAFLSCFDANQRPTVSVLDENQPTLDWFHSHLGYDPIDEWPIETTMHFGDPTRQEYLWRLQAPTIGLVRARLALG